MYDIINKIFTEDTTNMLMLVFLGIVVLVFVSVSWILSYHWESYGVGRGDISNLRRVYFGVSVFLFLVMAVSFFMFI